MLYFLGVIVILVLGVAGGVWFSRNRQEIQVLRQRLSFTPDRDWSQIPGGDPRENLPPQFSPAPRDNPAPARQEQGDRYDQMVRRVMDAALSGLEDRIRGGGESVVGGRQDPPGQRTWEFRLSARGGRPHLEHARGCPQAALQAAHRVRAAFEERGILPTGGTTFTVTEDGSQVIYSRVFDPTTL